MISYIGKSTVESFTSAKNLLFFIAQTVVLSSMPSSWDRSTKKVLIKQIYFTSVQILPLFFLISIFFGATIVGGMTGMMRSLDLINTLGGSAVDFVVTELAPLTTVALLILRSASATNAEIAVMRVNLELETLRAFGIDPNRYLAVPRMVNMVISLSALSTIFIVISAVAGSLIVVLFFGMSFGQYFSKIIQFITLDLMLFLYIKTALFGIAISVIPIYSGINSLKMLSFIPISVLKGMVGVFKAILFIEVMIFLLKLI